MNGTTTQNYRYCGECGNKQPRAANFCSECGVSMTSDRSEIRTVTREDTRSSEAMTESSGTGGWSIFFGIVALATAIFIPILGVISGLTGLGMSAKAASSEDNSMGAVGLALSLIGLLVAIAAWIYYSQQWAG